MERTPAPFLFLLVFTAAVHLLPGAAALGVNYGTYGNNLPPPAQVATFLKTQTIIDSIKIFDTNPEILRAFAKTDISVTVTVGNGDIPALANVRAARRWVAANIKPFYPDTKFKYICVGNEILFSNDPNLVNSLVPAMRSLNRALIMAGINDVKVTTAHALNIFDVPILAPSTARFRRDAVMNFFVPILTFHRRTKSPFMINPYPYFDPRTRQSLLDYALYRPNPGKFDPYTKARYTNMMDDLLDSTYAAMKAVGYGDIPIVIGETGWPSAGDPMATVENALQYNGNLIRDVMSGKGTPLMPKRTFETYIFALFNENAKPGPEPERNWGLFRPDFSPVYRPGVLRNPQLQPAAPTQTFGRKFCVPKEGVSDEQLQANLDYVCSQGVDCKPIQAAGACALPNTVRSHAAFAMNSYYDLKGEIPSACDFRGTAQITNVDPSYGGCHYL